MDLKGKGFSILVLKNFPSPYLLVFIWKSRQSIRMIRNPFFLRRLAIDRSPRGLIQRL
jgi:hypothetical protein